MSKPMSEDPHATQIARPQRPRPLSPNIQNYRPQLTSVLSIANRVTALISTLTLVAFVVWLIAAALSPGLYAVMQAVAASSIGVALLVIATFAFFLHLCGSVRHLVWDGGSGFELSVIYASGWAAVAASLVLTAAVWTAGLLLRN